MSSADAYELHAREFLEARDRYRCGAHTIDQWARSLPPGIDVIELACGGGYPVTQALVDAGLNVWAIDASSTLLETFRSRFPGIPTQCASVLESNYFGRKFDAAVAIGLVFLLEESEQVAFIHRMAEILRPGARFLFTAPTEIGKWQDETTGHLCRSLGEARYVQTLESAGFRVIATHIDEGKNHYYEVQKLGALP